jgi:membrane-associated phospholipid phosphatase
MNALRNFDIELYRLMNGWGQGDAWPWLLITQTGLGLMHISPLLGAWTKVTFGKVGPWFIFVLAAVAVYVEASGDGLVLEHSGVFLLCWAAFCTLDWVRARAAVVAFLSSGFIHLVIKQLWKRERPSNLDFAQPIEYVYHSASFPSGHTATAFAVGLFLFITLEKPWIRWTALIWGIMVGVSRVVVGVHYPIDVLAGYACGAFGCWVALKVYRKKNRKNDSSKAY